MLLDRSIWIGQKLVENANVEKSIETFWVIFKQCVLFWCFLKLLTLTAMPSRTAEGTSIFHRGWNVLLSFDELGFHPEIKIDFWLPIIKIFVILLHAYLDIDTANANTSIKIKMTIPPMTLVTTIIWVRKVSKSSWSTWNRAWK